MTIEVGRTLAVFAVCAVGIFITRVLPFLLFGKREIPGVIRYLGSVLPMAIMSVLILYCVKDISFLEVSNFLPKLLAVGVTVFLHLWRKNTTLSIFGGTVVYMVLIRIL